MTSKHTPPPWWPNLDSAGSWQVLTLRDNHDVAEEGSEYGAFICMSIGDKTEVRTRSNQEANARLIAAAPELLAELQRAQDFIDGIRQELHQRRVADWYPEGVHNAAEQMSEDMRLLGNACADFDTSTAIAKATGN